MYQSFRIYKRCKFFGPYQRFYSSSREATYYEILNVSKNATKQDIRLAFIKLSKENHPDKSNKTREKSHADFVKINEAYSILSKDHSRNEYDAQLKHGSYYAGSSHNSQRARRYEAGYSPYEPYYHVKRDGPIYQSYRTGGGPKKYNITVQLISFFLFVSIIGTIFQVMAILGSPNFKRQTFREKSNAYAAEYHRVRRKAMMGAHEAEMQRYYNLAADNTRDD